MTRLTGGGTRTPMADEPDLPPESQRTWGGRFATKPAELMTRINASIGFDKKLWREDIEASKAHASMLCEQGIIDAGDAAAILQGLDLIAAEFEADGVPERSWRESCPSSTSDSAAKPGALTRRWLARFVSRACTSHISLQRHHKML